ncbi:unnamed protein product [Urochloa humidicola]
MRREGRQHGWVFAVDRSLVDAEGKIRARAVQADGPAAANGGFVKAPRKPTNHSKPAVGRAYKALIGKGEAGGSGRGSGGASVGAGGAQAPLTPKNSIETMRRRREKEGGRKKGRGAEGRRRGTSPPRP